MIKLSPKELALYRQCINVVLHGFHEAGMEQTVGAPYATLMKEDAAFFKLAKSSEEVSIDDLPFPIRPLVIAEAIRQLGKDDFEARTGAPQSEGDRLLEKVKKQRA